MNASRNAPPHLVITEDTHGPNLWITALFGLSLCTVAVIARAFVKIRFKLKRFYDDLILAFGYGMIVLQCALLITSLTKQLGTTFDKVDRRNVAPMERYFFASQLVLVSALYFPKLAMIHLLKSVFALESRLLALRFIASIAGVASLLAASAGCSPYPGLIFASELDKVESQCSSRLVRWSIVVALDIAMEVVIFGSYLYFLHNVQLRKTAKVKVVIALSARVLCIVFALLFITSYKNFLKSSNPGTSIIIPAIYQQCNLSASVILAATLPCFRLLFQSSELIDYPLNPYTRSQMRTLHTPVNDETKAPPGELGDSEKRILGRRQSSSTGIGSDISKVRTLTF